MQRENRRLAAIVAADIAGYSRLISQNEEGALRALPDSLDACNVRSFKVAARSSTFADKGRAMDTKQFGRELGDVFGCGENT